MPRFAVEFEAVIDAVSEEEANALAEAITHTTFETYRFCDAARRDAVISSMDVAVVVPKIARSQAA